MHPSLPPPLTPIAAPRPCWCGGQPEGGEGESGRELARNLCLLDLLAATCENKDPASDVFAASYLPFSVTAQTIARLHSLSPTQTAALNPSVAYGLKGAFFRFVKRVYLGTEVRRLAKSIHSPTSNLWPGAS